MQLQQQWQQWQQAGSRQRQANFLTWNRWKLSPHQSQSLPLNLLLHSPLSCLASWQRKWAEIFGQKPLEDYTHFLAVVLSCNCCSLCLSLLDRFPLALPLSLSVILSLSLCVFLLLWCLSLSFSLWLHRNKVVGLCWRFLALPIAVINHNVQPWRTFNSYTARFSTFTLPKKGLKHISKSRILLNYAIPLLNSYPVQFPCSSHHTPSLLTVHITASFCCAHLRPALRIRTVKPSSSGYTAGVGSTLFLLWVAVTLRHSYSWILSVFGYVKRVFDAVSGLLQFNSGSTSTHSYASHKGVKHYDSDPKNKKKKRQKNKLG